MKRVLFFVGTLILEVGIVFLFTTHSKPNTFIPNHDYYLAGRTVSASVITPTLYLPLIQSPLVLIFSDEFDGNVLDSSKWLGTGTVADGKLLLSDTEIQSQMDFTYGILQAKIESSDWKAQDSPIFTDASFGFEKWIDACHYGVLLKANGHLGVLQESSCPTINEEYPPVPTQAWNAIRSTSTIFLTLTWSPNEVTMHLSDGSLNSTVVTGTLVPDVPLKLRFNADWDEPHVSESYSIDYIRVYQVP